MLSLGTPESFLGGFLIENFISFMLNGINLAQSYIYWLNRDRDSTFIQQVIFLVVILETIQSAFLMHATYHYTILTSCNTLEDLRIVWSAGACVILVVIVTALVQLFYIRRIWIVTRRNVILTSIPATLLVLRASFGLGTGVFTCILGEWPRLRAESGPRIVLELGIAFSAATDVTIATILIYSLRKSRTGFQKTDHVIEKLMAYAVHTGAITSLGSLGVIFLFVFMKESLAFAGLSVVTSKLYANSLLGTLNARQALRLPLELQPQSSSQLIPIKVSPQSSEGSNGEASGTIKYHTGNDFNKLELDGGGRLRG